MPQPDLEQQTIDLIEAAGKKPTEIISVGNSSKGTTVVVFVDEEGKTFAAEIGDGSTRIFEVEDD